MHPDPACGGWTARNAQADARTIARGWIDVRVRRHRGFKCTCKGYISRVTISQAIWGEDERLTLPILEADIDADVCVVGLGGSGLTCVNALASGGRRIVGIDAVGVAAGAAGRNGGFLLGGLAMFHHDAVIRLGHSTATAIYEETLKQIDRMA